MYNFGRAVARRILSNFTPGDEMKDKLIEFDGKVFGIDLGTTYSCIAHVDASNQPEIIPNSQGERTTPSAVYFESPESVIVGKIAKESADIDANSVVTFIKREMDNADQSWSREINGVKYNPMMISAAILRQLALDASANLNEEVKNVVITVPAYFGDSGKDATKTAGEIANLNVLGIIEEPTAAAIAYGMNQEAEKTILVYDLGGGTFDITVIKVNNGVIEVICTDGDHHLGGKNWDDVLVKLLIDKFEAETGPSTIRQDPEAMQSLAILSETIKQRLSSTKSSKNRVQHDGASATIETTQEEFIKKTSELLQQSIDLTKKAMDAAKKKGVTQFDEIILVGGSTKMPQVAERIEKEFSIKPKSFKPDEAVALGAALYARQQQLRHKFTLIYDSTEEGMNSGKSSEEVLNDPIKLENFVKGLPPEKRAEVTGIMRNPPIRITRITSKTYGVDAIVSPEQKNMLCNVLMRNTQVPCKKEDTFSTIEDDQRTVRFEIRESIADKSVVELEEGTPIGEVLLKQLPSGLPAGTPISVHFSLDDQALLFFRAQCAGVEVHADFKRENALSEQQKSEAQKNLNKLHQDAN